MTIAQQELAESFHGWFVDWIKDPSAGPGWARFKAEEEEGVVVKIGVPGREGGGGSVGGEGGVEWGL